MNTNWNVLDVMATFVFVTEHSHSNPFVKPKWVTKIKQKLCWDQNN